MRFASIVGARPQFIKVAVVSNALRQRHEERIIHTGQHYDYNMSAQFFEELAIPAPDYHLECGSGPHGAQTGRMLEAIEQVLLKERFDWIIFASGQAVRAFVARSMDLGASLHPAGSKLRIAAVGPVSAEAVRQTGLLVEYVARTHSGVGLRTNWENGCEAAECSCHGVIGPIRICPQR